MHRRVCADKIVIDRFLQNEPRFRNAQANGCTMHRGCEKKNGRRDFVRRGGTRIVGAAFRRPAQQAVSIEPVGDAVPGVPCAGTTKID